MYLDRVVGYGIGKAGRRVAERAVIKVKEMADYGGRVLESQGIRGS